MSTESPAFENQELWHNVKSLQSRVAALERGMQWRATPSNLNELAPEVVRITQELFPGRVSIREVNDPEYPLDSYAVVEAEATGTIEEIEDRRIDWHKRMSELSESCRLLSLSLTYGT